MFVITDHGSNDTAIQIKDTLTSAALVTHRRKSLLSTCGSCLGQSVCVQPFVYTLFDSILAFIELRLFFREGSSSNAYRNICVYM